MKLIIQPPKKAINKAFLKQRPLRSEMDLFKAELINLLDRIDPTETEEFQKNLVSDFLKKAIYPDNFINTKGRQDLVIHNGKDNKTSVGVIIEAKRPSNKGDWFTADKPNTKAIHELVLYYLRERIECNNIDIKYVIATNINEWYIFEASYFEKLFYKNKQLVKNYKEWRDGKKVTKDTSLFYTEIAKSHIDSIGEEIPCTYFNIQDYLKALKNEDKTDDKNLIALLKVLSPQHLLKVPFSDDSNELDQNFYKELLHIIGLEELKESGKIIIRQKEENKNSASLLEMAIKKLRTKGIHKITDVKTYGETSDEQYFNVALELCITWINRILFLKLLEGQLISYHKGDKSYRFLNTRMVHDFDELFKLFHNVLAVNIHDRDEEVKEKYKLVPYLNSSLFEITELEDLTISIDSLDNSESFDLLSTTILKEGKKKGSKPKTLEYLFNFLDAYDFASEGSEDIQEDNKPLINASVLGKVFEKINGYKEGSVFTPGFITMHMCKQSIRLGIIQKFNDTKGWEIKTIDELYNKIEDITEANKIINDLKICDPAVGSGHFLVSALNEIIAIKSELKILKDRNGKRLKEYTIDVENDELYITDEDGEIFEYIPQNKESQRIQETLFLEKQTIIENCLFGVDINPNSVKICRLRLWIELLKNAYYKAETGYNELETLPNIDINIKCGNSLMNRFGFDEDLSKALKSIKYDIKAYRGFVNEYKNERNRDVKKGLQKIIDNIKSDFRTEIFKKDPKVVKLNKISGELYYLLNQTKLFTEDAKQKKARKEKQAKLEAEINKLTKEIEEIKTNVIFKNAFEWRFEFPEVLDNTGNFIGFDIIIGNPPYIGEKELSSFFNDIKKIPEWFDFYRRRTNIYYFFMKRSNEILKSNGKMSLIIPREFLTADWANKLRRYLLNNLEIVSMIDFDKNQVFKDAGTTSLIFTSVKTIVSDYKFPYLISATQNKKLKELDLKSFSEIEIDFADIDKSGVSPWVFNQQTISGNKLIKLGSLFTAVQGLVTGADKVTLKHVSAKLIQASFLHRGIFVLTEGIDIKHLKNEVYLLIENEWTLVPTEEQSFIKPFVYSLHIKKWSVSKTSDYVIFFGASADTPNVILQYLEQFKTILINRAKVIEETILPEQFSKFTRQDIKDKYSSAGAVQRVMKNKQWYLPLYERTDFDFDGGKIIVNAKNKTSFSLSLAPCYSSGGGLGGQNFIFPNIEKNKQYFKELQKRSTVNDFLCYVTALLNSCFMTKNIEDGKYNQLSTQKIEDLLIYRLDFESETDIYSSIVDNVKSILKNIKSGISDNSEIEKKLDTLIEPLYFKNDEQANTQKNIHLQALEP